MALTRALLCVAAFAAAAAAQDMETRLAEKLEKEFVKKAPWVLDYAEALGKSKESGKPVFAYFTRSYAP